MNPNEHSTSETYAALENRSATLIDSITRPVREPVYRVTAIHERMGYSRNIRLVSLSIFFLLILLILLAGLLSWAGVPSPA